MTGTPEIDSVRQAVFEAIKNKIGFWLLSDEVQNSFLYKEFSSVSRSTLRNYKKEYREIKEKNIFSQKYSNSLKTGSTHSQAKQKTKSSQTGLTHQQTKKKLELSLPKKDPGFERFSRWYSYPHYKGLYKWQLESHNKLFDAKFSLELVHRDAGKSIKYCVEYEWAMLYKNFDILLLGWTDRRKEIALNTYIFFYLNDMVIIDKRTSQFHFRLKNGGKFDCYLITGKEALGMHSIGKQERFVDLTEKEIKELKQLLKESDGEFDNEAYEEFIKDRITSERKLWISVDDPIDISFMKERLREKDLEVRFDSTLYSINPDKWSFTGTHKFEGDIFTFWRKKFGNKLITYISGPFKKDGSLLCPERFTHPSLKTYQADLKQGKRDLQEIREHIGEYAWSSDWEQNPHPITHAVFNLKDDSFLMIEQQPLERFHDLCFIYIDRATTTGIKSDQTGCLIGIREKKTGVRIITHDLTAKIPLEHLLYDLCVFVREFKAMYGSVVIIMVIEQQGGGDDMIAMIPLRNEFEKNDKKVKNFIRDYVTVIPVHSKGEKIQRISDRLEAPIKNYRIIFMSYLKNSPIVNQLNTFPYCSYFDAIDGLAMGDFEIIKRPIVDRSYYEDMGNIYRKYTEKSDDEKEIPAHFLDSKLFNRFGARKKRVVFEK